jgi:UDPglucose 6-dehydrogenase
MKTVSIGSGYVGLVTGTCFAETGNQVLCVDNNQEKITAMQAGEIPIYEPDLETFFQRNRAANRLHFSSDLAKAVAFAELIFLALPTPELEDGGVDLSYVLRVSKEIAALATEYKIIANKGTVPVGTTRQVQELFGTSFVVSEDVVANP